MLDAPAQVVLERIKRTPNGRLINTERDVALLSELQRGIAVYYSGIIGCPLWIIDAEPNINTVIDVVEATLGLHDA